MPELEAVEITTIVLWEILAVVLIAACLIGRYEVKKANKDEINEYIKSSHERIKGE